MKKQLTRKELFDSIVAPSEQHLACVLLLDSSYSMIGDRIDSLNAAIKRFKRNVMTDEIARKRVEIAIVTFNSEVEVISDFVPIERMPTPEIRATGNTDMAGGINKAIEQPPSHYTKAPYLLSSKTPYHNHHKYFVQKPYRL